MTLLPRSAPPLLLCRTFSASHPNVAIALPLRCPRDLVLRADVRQAPSLTAVHSAVFGRIYQFNMVRPTTGMCPASVMHVLARWLVQSLIDKAVHLLQCAADPDMPIPVAVLGSGPNPAITLNHEVRV